MAFSLCFLCISDLSNWNSQNLQVVGFVVQKLGKVSRTKTETKILDPRLFLLFYGNLGITRKLNIHVCMFSNTPIGKSSWFDVPEDYFSLIVINRFCPGGRQWNLYFSFLTASAVWETFHSLLGNVLYWKQSVYSLE